MQDGKKRQRTPTRDEVLTVIRYVWKDLGVPQREFAQGTRLNQGSVSKILRGQFKAVEGRAYQVWEYAKHRADKAGGFKGQRQGDRADARLVEKIGKVWDRTEEGADALLKLLDAAALMQKRRRGERGE